MSDNDQQSKYQLPDPEMVITLDPPIERPGGGAVDQIVLREPTASQVRGAESHLRNGLNPLSMREYQLALVTSVSGVVRQVIDKMPVSKLVEASEYLQDFITPRRPTGET